MKIIIHNIKIVTALAMCLLFLVESTHAKGVTIFATNYPLAYFAERISGAPNTINFPNIDDDPADWQPTINDIMQMQQADVILLNGANYEKWQSFVSLPNRKVINTSKHFHDRYIPIKNRVQHGHGVVKAQSHTGVALTTWLDFSQAVQQANAIKEALLKRKLFPARKIEKNFNTLKRDLLHLDTEIATLLKPHAATPLIASHPVYHYFARRYGLNLQSIHWEPDSFPTETMWQELESLLKQHPAKKMIWEMEPMPETVDRLKRMGIDSLVFNPSSRRPSQGNFITAMKKNIANLRKGFGEKQ